MPHASEADIEQVAPAISHGMASEADVLPEQSFGAAAQEYGRKMNPVSMAYGLAENVNHPIDALKRWGDVNNRLLSNARDAAKRGDYTEAAAHALHYVLNGIPGLGEALDEAGTKMRDGDIAGGLADTAALGTQIIAGAKAPAIAKAAGTAGQYVGAASKAAAPGVLGGMAKAGAGEVLAKVPGMELPARFGLQYPALRQVAKAIEKGHEAGMKALEPKAAPSAASSATGATAAPAAEEAAAEPTLADGTTVQDIAKGQGIKSWKNASAEDKAGAQEIFDRLKTGERGPAPAAAAPQAYVPRTPADYGVKAAEVPPQPAQSAPAPTQPASAAPPSVPISTQTSPSVPPKVQPIRPEPTSTMVETASPTVEAPTTPKPASGATAAKSARYADAIGKWGRDMGLSVKQTAEGWEAASPEQRGQIYIELQRKGYLGANETIPKTSAQGIVDALKAKAATIKPPAGFSMGSMKSQ